MTEPDQNRYAIAFTASLLKIAQTIALKETNKDRQLKKRRVVEKKLSMFREAYPEATLGVDLRGDSLAIVRGSWDRSDALRLLVDLSFADPFAPYQLKYKDKDYADGLQLVAVALKLTAADVERVRETRKRAIKAHKHIAWGKIAAYGLGGLVVVGLGGWMFAPLIGSTIGVAAGLSGAAATSHGLAILGGGSLAIGGMGMAGGMWIVTGVAAAVGGGMLGGGTLLLNLGAAQAKVELVKLQMNYKLVLLENHVQQAKTQQVIRGLAAQRDAIAAELADERKLNEKNSARLKDMEETLRAVEDALGWIKDLSDAA